MGSSEVSYSIPAQFRPAHWLRGEMPAGTRGSVDVYRHRFRLLLHPLQAPQVGANQTAPRTVHIRRPSQSQS